MRELILIIFISCSLFVFANSAPTGSISGIVIDSITKEKIEYVSISLKKDGKIISGVLTDKKGNFKISEIPLDSYILEISFMGFITQSKKIKLSKEKHKINIGVIALKEDVTELETVEIRAETTSVIEKIDKKVIVVGNDLLASGSSALEILDNLPSIDVSAEGKVSYRGNENVMIYLDGKPTSISSENLLEQIPANTIKEIELISNPSARYNPEGIGGIINIVLNKNANLGFNGNLSSGIAFRKEYSTRSSVNLNFKKGKINVFGNFGYSDQKRNREGFFKYDFNNALNQYDVRTVKPSKLIKLGMDFRMNKKNTISIYTHQNYSNSVKRYESQITEPVDIFDVNTDYSFKNKVQIYNFNYKVEFDKPTHNLEFEVNFDNSIIDQNDASTDDLHTTSTLTNYQDKIAVKRDFTIFNLDYANKLNNGMSLEIGAETRIRKTDNKKQTNQLNLSPNSLFEYDRNEYSFYTTVHKKLSDKFSIKLGARIEYFESKSFLDGNFVHKDNYTTLYPSAYLTYKNNKKNIFKIGYSKHVQRPSLLQLNPTNVWSSYTMSLVGNPELIPVFIDYFELNYIRKFKKGTFQIVPYYQVTHNWISQSLLQDPNNPDKLLLSYNNADKTIIYAFETEFIYKIAKFWRITFGTYYSSIEHKGVIENQKIAASVNGMRFTLSQNFTVTKKLKISVLGKYYGKSRFLQITKEPFSRVDVASRYRFLNNKASLSLKFVDIFNTMDQGFYATVPYRFNGATTTDAQSVYISFSYKFGSSKIKNRRRKRHEKQEMGNGGF